MDCIFEDGSMSCSSPEGTWDKCASKTPIPQPRVPLVHPDLHNTFLVIMQICAVHPLTTFSDHAMQTRVLDDQYCCVINLQGIWLRLYCVQQHMHWRSSQTKYLGGRCLSFRRGSSTRGICGSSTSTPDAKLLSVCRSCHPTCSPMPSLSLTGLLSLEKRASCRSSISEPPPPGALFEHQVSI